MERHGKGNKKDSSSAIIDLNKICHEVKKHKYVVNPKF